MSAPTWTQILKRSFLPGNCWLLLGQKATAILIGYSLDTFISGHSWDTKIPDDLNLNLSLSPSPLHSVREMPSRAINIPYTGLVVKSFITFYWQHLCPCLWSPVTSQMRAQRDLKNQWSLPFITCVIRWYSAVMLLELRFFLHQGSQVKKLLDAPTSICQAGPRAWVSHCVYILYSPHKPVHMYYFLHFNVRKLRVRNFTLSQTTQIISRLSFSLRSFCLWNSLPWVGTPWKFIYWNANPNVTASGDKVFTK